MTRTFRLSAGFFVITAFCFAPALGQAPALPDHLDRLAGRWSGKTILHTPQGEVDAGTGTLVASVGPGSSIIIDYAGVSGRFADFRIHQVIAWDPKTGAVSMAWVDNFNPGVTHQAGRVSGSELVFTAAKTSSGERRESAIMDISEESFAIQSRAGSADEPMRPVLTLRFTRLAD